MENKEQETGQRPETERQEGVRKSHKVNGLLSKAIVASLFISMIVGSSFGFLASLVINRDFGSALERKLTSGDIAEKIRQGLDKREGQQFTPLAEEEREVIAVVKETNPAVVSIIISKDVPVSTMDDFFDPFFGFRVPGRQEQGPTQKQEVGGGSGFIVSDQGIIITNKHVVEDTQAEYTVLTNDEKKYAATVLGRDPVNDIAVLKVNPKTPTEGDPVDKLPSLVLGDSANLEVGQTVIAIGNSLGEFRNTVSKGIVSGLRRNIVAGSRMGQAESLTELIQTDAAINPGNSGGPLLDLGGQVIGVNVAIAADAQNIGFALPINSVKNVIDSVQREGRIVTPYIGIRYVLNTSLVASQNNLPYTYGALVMRGQNPQDLAVAPGSPADIAGIKENDLILEIDGKRINEEFTPSVAISQKKPGDNVILKVWSKGQERDVTVTLTERTGQQ